MIEIQVTGSMPVLRPDLSELLPDIEEIMLASVQLNLMMGGRPAFNVKHPNSTPLVGTGRMYRGIMSTHDAESATVYMDPSVVSKTGFFYPKALNDGVDVPPVEGKLMVFEIDGHTVFTYKRKGFRLGPFPFFLFQESDVARIMLLAKDYIFSSGQVSFN